jgi:uncharacterized protein
MMHPHTELRFVSAAIGYGVFATEWIPKGTMTWALDELDQKFEESYLVSLNPIFQDKLRKYCYRDNQGRYILCWDIARYVNHSFNANCISTPYEFELAARDIYPGEELRDDYGCLNLDQPFECLQEVGSPRTRVMPEDILSFYPEWDRKAADAMSYFNQVEQPLKNLIDPRFQDRVHAVASGQILMDSILACYYDRNSVKSRSVSPSR